MSELSNRAKQRNYFKMRLLGFKTVFYNQPLTQKELILADEIFERVNNILSNFTESSRELGFKASHRCRFCGKKATNDIDFNGSKIYTCDMHIGG